IVRPRKLAPVKPLEPLRRVAPEKKLFHISSPHILCRRIKMCRKDPFRRLVRIAAVCQPGIIRTGIAKVSHPHAPCGGIIPPHPQATALFLFLAFILSRNSAEKFRGRGYYTPTPPSCCEML